jgi:hypothetical protein
LKPKDPVENKLASRDCSDEEKARHFILAMQKLGKKGGYNYRQLERYMFIMISQMKFAKDRSNFAAALSKNR